LRTQERLSADARCVTHRWRDAAPYTVGGFENFGRDRVL
jgi:hypothetical protein